MYVDLETSIKRLKEHAAANGGFVRYATGNDARFDIGFRAYGIDWVMAFNHRQGRKLYHYMNGHEIDAFDVHRGYRGDPNDCEAVIEWIDSIPGFQDDSQFFDVLLETARDYEAEVAHLVH